MDTLLRSGTLLPIVPLRQSISGDVLIRDGQLVALGPQAAKQAKKPMRVVDLDGAWVLPGFIQSQVVLRDGLRRAGLDLLAFGKDAASKKAAAKTAEQVRTVARLGMARLALAGTTCALDAGLDNHVDALFEAARDIGGRLFSGLIIARAENNRPQTGRGSVQAALAEAEKLRKLWDGAENGRLHVAYLPGDVGRCDEDLLVELAGRARAGSCVLHCRLGDHPEPAQNMARMHAAGLTGPDVVMALGPRLGARDHKLLRESESRASHNPVADLRSGAGLAKLGEWRSHGVHLSLGTGSAAASGGQQILESLRTLALSHRHRGGQPPLDSWELLELATLKGAQALGLADQVGSLEPGKRADLIVIKPNMLGYDLWDQDAADTLVLSASSADIKHVLVDGEFVVRDGVLAQFDASRVEREALRLVTLLHKEQAGR